MAARRCRRAAPRHRWPDSARALSSALRRTPRWCISVYTHMNSGLILSRASDRPAYRQIIDQIKRRVSSGEWRPDDELPSIRSLATELRVSVITVRRAYLELEREGVVRTEQGRGSFVADGVVDLEQRLHEEELERHLLRAVELGALLGWTGERMARALERTEAKMRRETA